MSVQYLFYMHLWKIQILHKILKVSKEYIGIKLAPLNAYIKHLIMMILDVLDQNVLIHVA